MKSVFNQYGFLFVLLCCFANAYSQGGSNEWKAQVAVGVNSPSSSGFIEPYEANSINFPTVNLGLQYQFKPQLGAKLDFGFNRFANTDTSPDFKINYSRVNAQIVYDPTKSISFLPQRLGIVVHAGPGYSFIKPLNSYTENKVSFFNVMGGLELHYGINEKLSVFTDASYIYGMSKDFDPITEGFGSFNGDLFTLTFGVTFSLSGCEYCD